MYVCSKISSCCSIFVSFTSTRTQNNTITLKSISHIPRHYTYHSQSSNCSLIDKSVMFVYVCLWVVLVCVFFVFVAIRWISLVSCFLDVLSCIVRYTKRGLFIHTFNNVHVNSSCPNTDIYVVRLHVIFATHSTASTILIVYLLWLYSACIPLNGLSCVSTSVVFCVLLRYC
jgi:hypothetical protein